MQLPVVLWRLGLGPLLTHAEVRRGRLVMLTVTGRVSGLPRHTPVVAHEVGDRTYLWCPYGGRSQWYRNVTVDPVVTVQSRQGPRFQRAARIESVEEAVEVAGELRRFDETFLRSYLAAEGIADTEDDIARNWQRLHLRRLQPTQEQGPPPLEADLAWIWLVAVGISVMTLLAYARSVNRGHRTTSLNR